MRYHRLEKPGARARFLELRVEDCRIHLTWGAVGGGKRQEQWTTWESAAMAAREADAKLRRKARQGFVEIDVAPPADPYDPSARVIDVLSRQRLATGRPMYSFEPYDAVPGTFRNVGDRFVCYIVPNADGTRAAKTNVDASTHSDEILGPVIACLKDNIDAVMAVQSAAFFPLARPARRFEGVVVLSAWASLTEQASPSIARSVAWAVPGYRCEVSGHENIAGAELRKAIIGGADHDRAPVPVLDARYAITGGAGHGKSRGGARRFVVFAPSDLPSLVERVRQGTVGSWLELRNYRMQVARVERAADGLTVEGLDSTCPDVGAAARSFLRD